MKPILVAFAGLDGCGKSTQAELLFKHLNAAGFPAVITKAKQPRHEKILAELMEELGIDESSTAFTLLYQALHRRQFEETRDALAKGSIVIADRWNESFFVYHRNYGPYAGREVLLQTLDNLAFEGLKPDICFLLDVSADCAFGRREKRKGKEAVFSERKREFYEAIKKEYLHMAKEDGWVVLDASRPEKEVHAEICRVIFKKVGL